jgi:methionine biosynthesis protein MetW
LEKSFAELSDVEWCRSLIDRRRVISGHQVTDINTNSDPKAAVEIITSSRQSRDPRKIALEAHEAYYSDGTYDAGRLAWTLDQFLPSLQSVKVLEIGCGDGAMLQLLVQRGADAHGMDASSSGVAACTQKGLKAQCLDVSTDGIPFPDQSFDAVISLETFEHLMNPYYALGEVLRVLKPQGRFICSVPNPLTGHGYLYPGLFEYKNFRQFLTQGNFAISRVLPFEYAPRETILPSSLRKVPVLNTRLVAGGIRKIIEKSYLSLGIFPAFCYWLWTFECRLGGTSSSQFREIASNTRPGTTKQS